MKLNLKQPIDNLVFDDISHSYTYNGVLVPGVTSILASTLPIEKQVSLQNWRDRIGNEAANKVSNDAKEWGTFIHGIIEAFILGQKLNSTQLIAKQWSNKGFDQLTCSLQEVLGLEYSLYKPDPVPYAGKADCIGVYNGKLSIIDFKTSAKPKQYGWITDYFLQATAYAEAWNYWHPEPLIESLVILVFIKNGDFQDFTIHRGTAAWDFMSEKWAERLTNYVGGLK